MDRWISTKQPRGQGYVFESHALWLQSDANPNSVTGSTGADSPESWHRSHESAPARFACSGRVCVCVCVIRADRQLTSGRSYTAPTEATFNTSSLLYIYGNAIGCMCYIIIHQDRYWQEHRGNIYPLKYTRPVSWKKIILTVSIKMTWRYSTSSVSKNFFLN